MRSLWLPALLFAAALPAVAHHSFAAEYDSGKPIHLTGVIAKLDWMNPHAWIWLDVTGANGAVQHWGLSCSPPGVLTRRGLRRDDLKPGTIIQIDGFRAKDGSNNGYGRKVTLEDGRTFFTEGDEHGLRVNK